MNFHIRVRPSALVIQDDAILLVEYNSEKRGIHCFLPGGAEPRETIRQTLKREMIEETTADVTVGPTTFLYECEPQDRVDDYSPLHHTVFIIFDCELNHDSTPKLHHTDALMILEHFMPSLVIITISRQNHINNLKKLDIFNLRCAILEEVQSLAILSSNYYYITCCYCYYFSYWIYNACPISLTS